MYSAIIFLVHSDKLRLMRSEIIDIMKNLQSFCVWKNYYWFRVTYSLLKKKTSALDAQIISNNKIIINFFLLTK